MMVSTGYTILSWVLMVVVVALPTWIICAWASKIAPAMTHEKHKSGFGGALILFVAGQVAILITALWQASYMTSELVYMLTRDAQSIKLGAMAVLPVWLTVILCGVILWQIAAKRNAAAIGSIIVMLWISGPGLTLLQSWYFKMELTDLSMIQIFGWCIVWSIYLAISPRVALTYATPQGKKIVAGQTK
ncbi:MAG: hypothetical protein Q4E62_01085 [Sutterellaceae bacterium]|nr:hypothetical protein [Sutterellaceae bacterium]